MGDETALIRKGLEADREVVRTALTSLAEVWESALVKTETMEVELQESRGLVRVLAERLQATQDEAQTAHLSLANSEAKCAKLKAKAAAGWVAAVLAGGGAIIINLIGWWVI